MSSIDRDFWRGRRVFLTGHTGFKGGWLLLLLHRLGAKVTGFSLTQPVSNPALFDVGRLATICTDQRGDIRDLPGLVSAMKSAKPEVVIHMAAQPIVRAGIRDPIETLDVNVMGTSRVLHAARSLDGLQCIVSVTSDKCYENRERVWAYREDEAMGGSDPYSASKGCAELITASFAKTYFRNGPARVVSVRAGNVIGGGDWAQDRLVPDLVRAALSGNEVVIRSPSSIRPWQHVLDPLMGYLLAAQVAASSNKVHDAWNFGPNPGEELPVRHVVEVFRQEWGGKPTAIFVDPSEDAAALKQEAGLLRVDNTKAKVELGWRPLVDEPEAIKRSAEWYRNFSEGCDPRRLTEAQIEQLSGY